MCDHDRMAGQIVNWFVDVVTPSYRNKILTLLTGFCHCINTEDFYMAQ